MKKLYCFCGLCIVLACLSSCRQNSTENRTISFNENFESSRTATTVSVENPIIMNIYRWRVVDDRLYCQSDGTDACFYSFNLPDLSFRDSIGKLGPGPDEMVYPDLIPSFDQKDFYILDKGTFKLFKLNDASERIWETEMPTNVLNNIIALNDSIFGFAEFIPTKAALNIINIKSGNTISHIDFEDDNGEASSKYNFGWSIGPNRKAVLFLARFKKIMIADIDEDGKLCNINWVEGDTTAPSENYFYSGICCGSRYFYLLNRQNIDLEAQEGNAIIEIFDYDANPVSKIELDIPAWMMMLDEANHQMILLSPLDDDFHTVSLNGNEV